MRQTPILALLLTSAAMGQTVYLVDDDGGPGVDFLEIDDALAVAGPQDRIEVRPGSYREILVSDAATVMGAPGVIVDHVRVLALPEGDRAVLTDIAGPLTVSSCEGNVVAENFYTAGVVTVENSADVWLRGVTIQQIAQPPLRINNSTVFANDVEAVGSFVVGWGHVGRAGAVVLGNSLVVLAHSVVQGEAGGCAPSLAHTPGAGGPGLVVGGSSQVVLLESDIRGGPGDFFFDCLDHAPQGIGLVVGASARVVSDADVSSKYINQGGSFVVDGELPKLTITAPAVSPGTVAFALNAEVGTNGRNFMGRFTALAPLGAAVIPRAHNFSFGQFMGVTDASGAVASNLAIPAGRRGTVFFAQGASTDPNGRTALSNPIALVAR